MVQHSFVQAADQYWTYTDNDYKDPDQVIHKDDEHIQQFSREPCDNLYEGMAPQWCSRNPCAQYRPKVLESDQPPPRNCGAEYDGRENKLHN